MTTPETKTRMSVLDLTEWLSQFPPEAHVSLTYGTDYYLTVKHENVEHTLELD